MVDLKDRMRQFAVNVLRFSQTLKRGIEIDNIRDQLVRAATSGGAHYHAARRSKSDGDFLYKVTLALEEIDETAYWLKVLCESGLASGPNLTALAKEADELSRILCASCKTLKDRGVTLGKKTGRN